MTRYRYLDPMGDVVAEDDHPDHATAIAAVEALYEDVFRVEFRGPQGDWRWAGPLTS